MGQRLLTKAPRVDQTGAILVNYAAGRVGGAQVSRVQLPPDACVPFSGGAPLQDRKHLILTFPSDAVNIGRNPVSIATAYRPGGAGRGSNYTSPPNLARYSNRKQFLRGQYLSLSAFPAVGVCAKAMAAVEDVAALELS